MNKIFIIFLFPIYLFSNISWQSQHKFSLQKDEIAKVLIQQKGKKDIYTFLFRWTLYDTQKVVVLSNYKKFPRQHVMYFKHNKTFLQELFPNEYKNTSKQTYLLTELEKYDTKTKKMDFIIYIKDANKKLKIKYIDPPKKDEK